MSELSSTPLRVLVIDDERNILTTLSMCLEGMGCQVTAVMRGSAALAAIARLEHRYLDAVAEAEEI